MYHDFKHKTSLKNEWEIRHNKKEHILIQKLEIMILIEIINVFFEFSFCQRVLHLQQLQPYRPWAFAIVNLYLTITSNNLKKFPPMLPEAPSLS